MQKTLKTCILILIVTGTMVGYLSVGAAIPAETQVPEDTKSKKVKPAVPIDEYDRGTPRGTVEGFLSTSCNGEYKKAARYLDLRNLPGSIMILLDKSYEVGQRIVVKGHETKNRC